MRLYIDNQYSYIFINLVIALHKMDFKSKYEIVYGDWNESYTPETTVVFLWEDSKKGIRPQIKRYYHDGYKVFTFKKPYNRPLNLFNLSVLMLSKWKIMLDTIEKTEGRFLFTINDSKTVLKKVA